MGALIPNGNDTEVINQLNSVFTGPTLAKLRRHIRNTGDDMFGPTRHLPRISYRLKVAPTGTRGKGRWYVFLRDLIGSGNQQKILTGLRDAVADPTCMGIRFWARLDPSVPTGYDVEVVSEPADSNGQHWVTMTMLCDHEINPSLPGDPNTPPANPGEQPPTQPAVSVARKAYGAAKKAAKKAVTKSYKKAAKKKK
ncbi:MAG: hypothetical protein QOD11_2519 [Bradyrhizobium sp.]|jgi:hypothetical protein|nr:hypothetical protein [Bradyrhizobium sp.]